MDPVITHRRLGAVIVAIAFVDVVWNGLEGDVVSVAFAIVFGLLGVVLIGRDSSR